MRQRTGAIVCPRCERLIGASEERCPHCGAWQPGMFGFGPALSRWLGGSLDLANAITVTCVALYLLSLALDPGAILSFSGGIFGILSPSGDALFKLGMTGPYAVFGGRPWTLCTAIFLHGGALHILFNMAVMRMYLPNVEHLFGPVRAFLIFMVAGILGFVVSVVFGGHNSVGASGAIFGLLGALISYGRRTGQSHITNQLWGSAIMMFLMGFMMSGVDNFAHAGGFAGGFVCANFMPTAGRREQAGELAVAGLLSVITLVGFVLSLFGFSFGGMR
ncbi:MAG: rhomboid family intramembrane serine protease [Candidatus Eisenbacteria bacterium]|uniref:Rhomboid family intramembrane serine protease n=1 Tax=Eiseniibacteriota bacterium TaxID=2212470 RepID=A0A933W183_UNCEI|nr:rhomboid family intramembrane serine protease [Candidatus Eisenbacteria bacterium]